MTEKNKVIRIFESFVLGFCKCGCKTEINIRSGSYLRRFKIGHSNKGKHLGKNGNGRFLVNGYWRIYKPDYFSSDKKSGSVLEHVYIYQEYYKCCVLSWCDIHHIDETPEAEDANRIENLRGMTKVNHLILHHRYKKLKDMSNRVCLLCGSKETFIQKINGRPFWLKYQNGFICRKCYQKIYDKEKKKRGG